MDLLAQKEDVCDKWDSLSPMQCMAKGDWLFTGSYSVYIDQEISFIRMHDGTLDCCRWMESHHIMETRHFKESNWICSKILTPRRTLHRSIYSAAILEHRHLRRIKAVVTLIVFFHAWSFAHEFDPFESLIPTAKPPWRWNHNDI